MRASHELLKQNLTKLKQTLQISLNQARVLNFPPGDEIALEISHKIRQIDGIVLALNGMGSGENGIRFTDLFFAVRQIRHQCHQIARRLASFHNPLYFSPK